MSRIVIMILSNAKQPIADLQDMLQELTVEIEDVLQGKGELPPLCPIHIDSDTGSLHATIQDE